jgi:hypothetical protein
MEHILDVFRPRSREFAMPGGRKISVFDGERLNALEDLFDGTWLIFAARYPFRDIGRDESLRQTLRLKLFIHAENFGLENLDAAQQLGLESMSREFDEAG